MFFAISSCFAILLYLHYFLLRYLFTGKRQTSPGEGSVLEVRQWNSLLLYTTQRGGLHAWDLRSNKDAFHLTAAPSQVR